MTRDRKFDISSTSPEINIHSKVDVKEGITHKMFKVNTDEGLGLKMRNIFHYGLSPWSKNPTVAEDEVETKKSGLRSSAPKKFFGKFSMIASLGTSFTVGIAHSSHSRY